MTEIKGETLDNIRKYLGHSLLNYKELQKYYNITRDTAKQLRNKNIKTIMVNEEEYQSIKHILEHERPQSKIVVTDKIFKRMSALTKFLTVGYVGDQLNMSRGSVNDILHGRKQYISLTQKKQLDELYNDILKGSSKQDLDADFDGIDTKKIAKRAYKKVLINNRKRFQKLEIGKSYNIYQKRYRSEFYDKELIFSGTITEEYGHYYLGEHNGRKVTFLKNLLFSPDTVVEEVNSGEVSRVSETN